MSSVGVSTVVLRKGGREGAKSALIKVESLFTPVLKRQRPEGLYRFEPCRVYIARSTGLHRENLSQ